MKFFAFTALLLSLAVAGHGRSTDTERQEFLRQAEEVLPRGSFALFIVPPSSGSVNESVVSTVSLFGGPSKLVRNAAETVRECRKRKIDLVVAGKTPAKCRAAMAAALKLMKDESLGGMTILYLIPHDAGLAQQTETLGGKPVFKDPNQPAQPTRGKAPRG